MVWNSFRRGTKVSEPTLNGVVVVTESASSNYLLWCFLHQDLFIGDYCQIDQVSSPKILGFPCYPCLLLEILF